LPLISARLIAIKISSRSAAQFDARHVILRGFCAPHHTKLYREYTAAIMQYHVSFNKR